MACGCEKCQAAEKLASNITPEVEQLLEQLAAGAAAKIQQGLDDKIPAGLPQAFQKIVLGVALMSLAEAFTRGLPEDRKDLAARIAVRIVAASDRLRAEQQKHDGGVPGGIVDAMRKAGFAVQVETIPVPPAKG